MKVVNRQENNETQISRQRNRSIADILDFNTCCTIAIVVRNKRNNILECIYQCSFKERWSGNWLKRTMEHLLIKIATRHITHFTTRCKSKPNDKTYIPFPFLSVSSSVTGTVTDVSVEIKYISMW